MMLHQVAEYLDCSYATVLLLVMRDGLLVFRLGSDGWRVRRSDLGEVDRGRRRAAVWERASKDRWRPARAQPKAEDDEIMSADENNDRRRPIPRAGWLHGA